MIIHHNTYSSKKILVTTRTTIRGKYGTEPLPYDHTWRSTSVDVDVSPNTGDVAE
jgi:hypothetical protein